jgi:hypothetical protein
LRMRLCERQPRRGKVSGRRRVPSAVDGRHKLTGDRPFSAMPSRLPRTLCTCPTASCLAAIWDCR